MQADRRRAGRTSECFGVAEQLAADPMPAPCGMQIDVEGYETMVIRSMAKLVKHYMVENYILEYSPGTRLACQPRTGAHTQDRRRADPAVAQSRCPSIASNKRFIPL